MKGHVDQELRALIPIRVTAGITDEPREYLAWVDTAFNGSFVIPRKKAEELQLPKESSVEAILANGTKVELETFGCMIEWFGETYQTQIVTNDSTYGLIGTMLLAGNKLEIDYGDGTVTLEKKKSQTVDEHSSS
jgi:clan AA aspartic protease